MGVLAVGRIYRIRSTLTQHCISISWSAPKPPRLWRRSIYRCPALGVSADGNGQYFESLNTLIGKSLADIPLIEDHAYVRELLQCAVVDDLLRPLAGLEWVVDMGVRDRYLVE